MSREMDEEMIWWRRKEIQLLNNPCSIVICPLSSVELKTDDTLLLDFSSRCTIAAFRAIITSSILHLFIATFPCSWEFQSVALQHTPAPLRPRAPQLF
jgi:hypothetical protein